MRFGWKLMEKSRFEGGEFWDLWLLEQHFVLPTLIELFRFFHSFVLQIPFSFLCSITSLLCNKGGLSVPFLDWFELFLPLS
jgi:hypothetical protein